MAPRQRLANAAIASAFVLILLALFLGTLKTAGHSGPASDGKKHESTPARLERGHSIPSLRGATSATYMTDGDLKAIFAYLRTLPRVQHRVDNTEPPTLCWRCGQKHGYGERN